MFICFGKKGKGVYGIFNFITFHLTCECYFQTVLLADILPTLIIKITAPFYMQRIPYRWDKDQIYYHLLWWNQRKKLNQRCVEINILSNMRSIWFSLYAAFEKDRLPQLHQVQKLLQLQTNYFNYSKYCKFSKLNPPLTTNTPSTLSTSKTSAATNVYNIAQKKKQNKKKTARAPNTRTTPTNATAQKTPIPTTR